VGIVYFVCSYGFVTFEQLEDAEKLMKREVQIMNTFLTTICYQPVSQYYFSSVSK